MFVRHVYTDLWLDGVDRGAGIVDPTWEAVSVAIRSLDATTRSLITLADREWSDHFLLVVGKWEDRVLVNSTKNNKIFFSLVDASSSGGTRTLLIAGEREEYDDNKLVPIDWAIEAAQHFYETGERKSTMSWMRDA
ncbi:MAG TPA: Imm1 family immunity protein [Pirellulales bacterium]|jgi:hypothetical protein